jgi:hypothetical protein
VVAGISATAVADITDEFEAQFHDTQARVVLPGFPDMTDRSHSDLTRNIGGTESRGSCCYWSTCLLFIELSSNIPFAINL